MLFDRHNQFSNRQAVTATAPSTDYINTGAKNRRGYSGGGVPQDIGVGTNIPLLVQVTDTLTGGTSVTVALQTDDNPAFSSPKTVFTTGAIPTAQLVAGYRFNVSEFPIGTEEQYIRLLYTVAGTYTAGTITAGVVAGVQANG